MAVGDTYQTKVYVTLGSQTAINVRHWQVTAEGPNVPTEVQMATFFDALWAPLYKALLPAVATYRGVIVQRILPAPPTIGGSSNANAGVGDSATDPMPKQVAGVITLRTDFAGRSYRGRVYVPFPGESFNDTDGTPSLPYVLAMNDLAATLVGSQVITAGANSITLASVIRSQRLNANFAITSSRANDRWGTQRRRGDYGSPNISPL